MDRKITSVRRTPVMKKKEKSVEQNKKEIIVNTGQVYDDSVIWTMFMQSILQNWQIKTKTESAGIAMAASAADICLEEYKKRF